MTKKRNQEEELLQIDLWEICETHCLPRVMGWHTPNGGYRAQSEANRLKMMGVRPGVYDLIFIRADGKPVFLELKARKGKLRPDQIEFQQFLLSVGAIQGVAHNLEDAVNFLVTHQVLKDRSKWHSPSRPSSSPRTTPPPAS